MQVLPTQTLPLVPVLQVTAGTYTYTGSPQGPDATNTGNTGTGSSYTFSYAGTTNASASFGPGATQPTEAGNYTVTATVAASTDGDWAQASSTATNFTIDREIPPETVPNKNGTINKNPNR